MLKEYKNRIINTIKSLSKKSILFLILQTLIAIVLVLFATCYKSTGLMDISSSYDSVVYLDSVNTHLTQSYQIPNRNVTDIVLKVDPEKSNNQSGLLMIQLSSDLNGEEVLGETLIELSEGISNYTAHLGSIIVEQGCRYYIQVELQSGAEDTSIAFLTNSNYAGLSLDGGDIAGALASSLLYSYSGNIAGLLKILLVFSSVSFIFMLVFRRDFGACIGMAFATILIYLLLFGVFGGLNIGVISLYALCMGIVVLFPIFVVLRGRKWSEFISPAYVGFIALFFLYFVFDRNAICGRIDDLNHWQLAVRDMWYSDSFAYHAGSAIRTQRYMPGFATIEYFFIRMYGSYREGIVLLAANSAGFAFLGVMLSNISWKKWCRVFPVIVIIATLPLFFFPEYYGMLYVDSYLGIIGAYLFICYFTEEYSVFQVLRITLASVLLIMTKEMGLVIAFTFYLAVLLDLAKKNNGIKKLFANISTKMYCISSAVAVLFFIIWEIYVKVGTIRLTQMGENNTLSWSIMDTLKHGVKALFESAKASIIDVNVEPIKNNITSVSVAMLDASRISNVFLNTQIAKNSWAPGTKVPAIESIKELFLWMFEDNMYYGRSFVIVMSVLVSVFVLIGMSGTFTRLHIDIKRYMLCLALGFTIYQLALLATYIFVFYEGDAISAQERYIASYMILVLIALVGALVVGINKTDISSRKATTAICLIGLLGVIFVPEEGKYHITPENGDLFYKTWEVHQKVSEPVRTFANKGEKILYVSYEDSDVNPYENYITFRNAIVPTLNQYELSWKIVPSNEEHIVGKSLLSVDRFGSIQGLLANYDYVYIRDYSKEFLEAYAQIFDRESALENGGFYRVIKNEGDTVLHKIAYFNLQ